MGEERGNSALSVLIILLCYMFCDMAYADTFTVGDKDGWKFGVSNWPQGKTFKAGDTLVFNYSPLTHDVVAVDEAGYKNCNPGNGKVYKSGHDSIVLPKGPSYFICTFPQHCVAGMKIAVNAA